MKNLSILLCVASFLTLNLLSSCEEATPQLEYKYEKPSAEEYLRMHDVPAVMFSINRYDAKSQEMDSYLIDSEGKVRTTSFTTNKVFEYNVISPENLEAKRNDAALTNLADADLEAMVDNFNLLRVVDVLTFDTESIHEETKNITSIYGYYYNVAHGESCGPTDSAASYKAILLEQSIDGQVIQFNKNGKVVLDFVKKVLSPEGE